jgi:hypothetical protein
MLSGTLEYRVVPERPSMRENLALLPTHKRELLTRQAGGDVKLTYY